MILCLLFHFINKSRYLWNLTVSLSTSSRPRIGGDPGEGLPSASRVSWGGGSLRWGCVLRLARRAAGTRPVHVPLLQDLKDVRHRPVQDEPRREIEEHEREDEGHDQHHLRLTGVARRRRHLLLHEHRHAHEERQDVRWVVTGEVADPDIESEDASEAQEGCVLELDGYG